MIPMPDTFIDRFHLLVKYQPELLIFNDSKVRLIWDGDLEITGVDWNKNEAPLLKTDNENDNLDNQ